MTRTALALLAAGVLGLVGCASDPGGAGGGASVSFPDAPLATIASEGDLAIEVRTAPEQPPSRGECSVELTVHDADGAPVDGLEAVADLWMPDMGHGASTDPDEAPEGAGRYRFDRVELFMPGRWEMRVQFSGEASDRATARFHVP